MSLTFALAAMLLPACGEETATATCSVELGGTVQTCPLSLGTAVHGPLSDAGSDRFAFKVPDGATHLRLSVTGNPWSIGVLTDGGERITDWVLSSKPAREATIGVRAGGGRYLLVVERPVEEPYGLIVQAGRELYEVEPNDVLPDRRSLQPGETIIAAVDDYRDSDVYLVPSPTGTRRLRFKLVILEPELAPSTVRFWQFTVQLENESSVTPASFQFQEVGQGQVMEQTFDLIDDSPTGTRTLQVWAGGHTPVKTRYSMTVTSP